MRILHKNRVFSIKIASRALNSVVDKLSVLSDDRPSRPAQSPIVTAPDRLMRLVTIDGSTPSVALEGSVLDDARYAYLATDPPCCVPPPRKNGELPLLPLPDLTIAAFWDDFVATSPSSRVLTKLFGPVGGRQRWIKWTNLRWAPQQ